MLLGDSNIHSVMDLHYPYVTPRIQVGHRNELKENGEIGTSKQ